VTTQRKNFTNQDTPSIVDTDYILCNFFHDQPIDVGGGVFEGVRLFPGDDTPRSFTQCNLVNCAVPPGSTVINCNTSIVETGLLGATETVTIDGQDVVIQHHKNRVHGKWTPTGYEYHPSPIEFEVD
jgi:hypothetical protein